MELFTKRNKNDYERIVDIYVSKSQDEVPYINDENTCKLLILKKGNINISIKNLSESKFAIKAPAAIYISNKDEVHIATDTHYHITTVFFKPSVINDAFQYDDLYEKKFEEMYETTLYQDYLLIRHFVMKDGNILKYTELSDGSHTNMTEIISKMDRELKEQYDDYWPCRSRSYFIELLFSLNFCFDSNPHIIKKEHSFVPQVIEYLNQNIDEKIDLEILTKIFHTNRNSLNKSFKEETGVTCLNYLMKIRMDLAKLLLAETQIPVAEIARRIGYEDQNYFTKLFKREYNVTPSEYRESYA